MATRTTLRTTVSRDPALVAMLEEHAATYPGASAQLDAADRAWLRARGVSVPDRAPDVPLHELARRAAAERKVAPKKKRQAPRRSS